jgi:hypothetical protein
MRSAGKFDRAAYHYPIHRSGTIRHHLPLVDLRTNTLIPGVTLTQRLLVHGIPRIGLWEVHDSR